MPQPDQEIRLLGLHSARGMNYWSRRPVIRMDLTVGAYDDISSADVPGVREALVGALPGLRDHHCSVGAPGGFVKRLRQGTYAPHIIEHVALELQSMIGHDVGYGKTRGGEEPGQYTLVFEYRHEQVGLRAAAIALGIVQEAFAGTLSSIEAALDELRALARTVDSSPIASRVYCGVSGGSLRHETQVALYAALDDGLGADGSRVVVDVAPAYVLRAGLPYARSEMAVLLDTSLTDVAERYREPEAARKLVGTLIDGVRRGGLVICPAKEWELQDYARDRDCRVAIFSDTDDVTRKDRHVAIAVAFVTGGRIVIEDDGEEIDAPRLDADAPVVPQVVAALGRALLRSAAGAMA
jgi:hypothetical protein